MARKKRRKKSKAAAQQEQEPSVEQILSSIRKLIADTEGEQAAVKAGEGDADEDVLVLTEVAGDKPASERQAGPDPVKAEASARRAAAKAKAEEIVKDSDVDSALEQLVREMLRNMIEDYLDRHLPTIVEKVAEEELAKLTRKKRG